MTMFKTKSNFKFAVLLMTAISLTPQYASALDCLIPSISESVQPTIDNPKTSAVIRGVLKLPKQKYSYNRGVFTNNPTRSSYGTINGFVANTDGFSTPATIKVELREDCNQWPNTDLCADNESVASSIEANSSIYFLDITKTGYVLTSGNCLINNIQETPEVVAEIATCFINKGC